MSLETSLFSLSESDETPEIATPAPKAPIAPPPPPRPAPAKTAGDFLRRARVWSKRYARQITLTGIILFICLESIWALAAGLRLRSELWQDTRTIHYNLDLYNMFRQGSNALREAEHQAGLASYADMAANQPDNVAATIRTQANLSGLPIDGPTRRLTLREILHGVVHYYDEAVTHTEESQGYQYEGLDYLPIRLSIATLWVRQVQRDHPTMFGFPGHARATIDTPVPQVEDIVKPLLQINTACELVSAVAMFALVWVWVVRSDRPMRRYNWKFWLPVVHSKFRFDLFAKDKPFAIPSGLLAFATATAVFWYAYVGFTTPPPRPLPTVNVVRAAFNGKGVSVTGTVNDQAGFSRWRIEWGDTATYTHSTPLRNLPPAQRDMRVQGILSPVQKGQTVHFSLVAIGPVGTSRTQDLSFSTSQPPAPLVASPAGASVIAPIVQTYENIPLGGIVWPDWKIWLCVFALFITMVVCARKLPMPHRAWACGLVAALLVWFDPITLLNSHAWPQWDVWILPFFTLAALAASLEWWLTAGVIIGIGCLSKGQLLLAAPVLMLWPLFGGRFGAFLRVLSGLAIGATLVLWPWLIRSDPAGRFVANIIMVAVPYACITLAIRLAWPKIKDHSEESSVNPWHEIPSASELTATKIARVTLAVGLILLMYCFITPPTTSLVIKLSLLAALTLPWIIDRWSIAHWLAGMIGAAVWVGAAFCDGDFTWWKLGFVFGSEKHDRMQMGEGSFANLPSILAQRYNWDLHQIVGHLAFHLHFPQTIEYLGQPLSNWNLDWGQDLDLKTCLAIVYVVTLLLCSFAASVHARRNDPRTLVAIIAPWLIFPIIMCQTSERYLLWSSALTAAMIAVSTGLSLLHVLLAIFAAGMIAHQLLQTDVGRWPAAFNFFSKAYPDTGWMMLLLAATFLIVAMMPSRRPVSEQTEISEQPL